MHWDALSVTVHVEVYDMKGYDRHGVGVRDVQTGGRCEPMEGSHPCRRSPSILTVRALSTYRRYRSSMARKSASFFCRLSCSSSIRRAAGGTRRPLSSMPSSGLPSPVRPLSPAHCCHQQVAPAPQCTRASAAAPNQPHAASACGQGTGSSSNYSNPSWP